MNKPSTISFDELVKTITMFWIDRDLEKEMSKEIENMVNSLSTKLTNVNTRQGIQEYIRSDKDALSNILGLMEISEERFKRIISMLRRERKFVFSTEWSLERTQEMLISDAQMMEDVCELLLEGATSERYKRKIPDFFREGFKIDDATMARLTDHNELTRLAKSKMEVRYNSSVSNIVTRKIEEAIKLTCDLEGLTYVKNKPIKEFKEFDKPFAFAIPDAAHARIIVDCSYNITTSSTQTKYADKIEQAHKIIRNGALPIIIVNVLEGAGWIGRQSDLKRIVDYSDYALNLSSIGMIDQIIRYGMEA